MLKTNKIYSMCKQKTGPSNKKIKMGKRKTCKPIWSKRNGIKPQKGPKKGLWGATPLKSGKEKNHCYRDDLDRLIIAGFTRENLETPRAQ